MNNQFDLSPDDIAKCIFIVGLTPVCEKLEISEETGLQYVQDLLEREERPIILDRIREEIISATFVLGIKRCSLLYNISEEILEQLVEEQNESVEMLRWLDEEETNFREGWNDKLLETRDKIAEQGLTGELQDELFNNVQKFIREVGHKQHLLRFMCLTEQKYKSFKPKTVRTKKKHSKYNFKANEGMKTELTLDEWIQSKIGLCEFKDYNEEDNLQLMLLAENVGIPDAARVLCIPEKYVVHVFKSNKKELPMSSVLKKKQLVSRITKEQTDVIDLKQFDVKDIEKYPAASGIPERVISDCSYWKNKQANVKLSEAEKKDIAWLVKEIGNIYKASFLTGFAVARLIKWCNSNGLQISHKLKDFL